MDSGASDTMFVSRDLFTNYKSVTPRVGDSAKAENGSFEIVGEGNVIQRYEVNGKEREITYTRALHTPTHNFWEWEGSDPESGWNGCFDGNPTGDDLSLTTDVPCTVASASRTL
jgi:hypothetical protein